MTEWQPIETVPKYNGTLLLWFPEFPGFLAQAWIGLWREDVFGWGIQIPIAAPDGRQFVVTDLPVQPTHWAPRPDAPSMQKKVRIPTDADEARAMTIVGYEYLKKFAQHRLK